MAKQKRLSTSMRHKVGYALSLEIYQFMQQKKRIPQSDAEKDQIIGKTYLKFKKRKGMVLDKGEFFARYRFKMPKKIHQVVKNGKPTEPTKKKRKSEELPLLDQDENFYFIAGYTDGGAPYGLTWEEMGLQPWEELPEDSGSQAPDEEDPLADISDEDLPF